MRHTVILIALLALGASAMVPPKQKVRLGVTAFDSATVTLQVTVTLANGPLRPTDLVRYNWFKDASLTVTKDTVATYAQVLPSPACGQTSTYFVNTKMVYAGVVDSRTVKSNVISYTAPSCPQPPPSIQSVDITPATVSLAPGGVQQFGAVTNPVGRPVTWGVLRAGDRDGLGAVHGGEYLG